jgi:hypothetical protein
LEWCVTSGVQNEAFGLLDGTLALIAEEHQTSQKEGDGDNILREIAARKSLTEAVDYIWLAAEVNDIGSDTDAALASQLAALSVHALSYAKQNPHPVWLSTIETNHKFVERLLNELEKSLAQQNQSTGHLTTEAFGADGLWAHITESIRKMTDTLFRASTLPLVTAVRPRANEHVSRFIGDVLVYLNKRGTVEEPGPIINTIIQALNEANAARSEDDKQLVIVAHSMGGNIAYDILTHFLPSMTCDVLITVGSQVSLFEELKLFRESENNIPSDSQGRVHLPGNIRRWLNVYDPADVLSYVCKGVFEGVEDFVFNTGVSSLKAHGMYFFRPSFHQRLSEHIK